MDKSKAVVVIDRKTGRELDVLDAEEFSVCENSYSKYLWGMGYESLIDDCEIELKFLDYKDFRKDKIYFSCGNIVRWCGELYIVARYREDNDGNRHLDLLHFDAANCSSHPCDTWPIDPRERISSVGRVATHMEDFLVGKFKEFMGLQRC